MNIPHAGKCDKCGRERLTVGTAINHTYMCKFFLECDSLLASGLKCVSDSKWINNMSEIKEVEEALDSNGIQYTILRLAVLNFTQNYIFVDATVMEQVDLFFSIKCNFGKISDVSLDDMIKHMEK